MTTSNTPSVEAPILTRPAADRATAGTATDRGPRGVPENSLRGRATGIRRMYRVLVLLATVVALDSLNATLGVHEYYDELPRVLYDFASTYQRPLTEWSSVRGFSTRDTTVIPFERLRGDMHPVPGYASVDSIPFMNAYLSDRLPRLFQDSRSLFGYRMAFPLYAILAAVVPMVIVLAIAWRIHAARREWLRLGDDSPRLVDGLAGSPQAVRRGRGVAAAVTAGVFLFLLAASPPILVSPQLTLEPDIAGELRVAPLRVPIVIRRSDEAPLLARALPTGYATMITFTGALALAASVFVTVALLRRRPALTAAGD